MALTTVGDYKAAARTLLQDTYAGSGGASYRYSDASLLEALNLAIGEVARLRPDLLFKLLRNGVPYYSNDLTTVDLDARYATSLLMFITGWAQLRDQEEGQDQRAAGLITKFGQQLTGAQSA